MLKCEMSRVYLPEWMIIDFTWTSDTVVDYFAWFFHGSVCADVALVDMCMCFSDGCKSFEFAFNPQAGRVQSYSISTTSACLVSRRALFRTSPWLDLAFARKLASHVTGCGFQCPSHTEDRVSGGPLFPAIPFRPTTDCPEPNGPWPKSCRWIRRRNKPSMSPQAGHSLAQAGRFSRFLALAFAAVS
jgi:hypothetical protein